jgi:hypothetical protein
MSPSLLIVSIRRERIFLDIQLFGDELNDDRRHRRRVFQKRTEKADRGELQSESQAVMSTAW